MSAVPRVLVSAVGGGSVGEQVCKALRCAPRDYELIVANTSLSPMKIVQAEHYELLPPAKSDDYLASLKQVIEKNLCDFVIPGSEVELLEISTNREYLNDVPAKLLINSPEVISLCLDKLRTAEFLSAEGFLSPATISLDDEIESVAALVTFPCIIKPAVGGGGSAFTFIAQDLEELNFFVGYLRKYGYRPLIQEYVGTASEEYTVGILHAPDGVLMGTSVMQRNLSGLSNRLSVRNLTARREFGPTLAVSSGISQGEFVQHEAIREECEAIANRLGSRGPLNIQGRWNGERFVTFEINPRFSGTSSMRAMAGFNEPDLLIQWYLHGRVAHERIEPRRGVFTRGLVEYFSVRED